METDSDNFVIIAVIGAFALLFTAITYISDSDKRDCVVKMSKSHSDWQLEQLQQACQ